MCQSVSACRSAVTGPCFPISTLRDSRKSLKARLFWQNARVCQRKQSNAVPCVSTQRQIGSGRDKGWYFTSMASDADFKTTFRLTFRKIPKNAQTQVALQHTLTGHSFSNLGNLQSVDEWVAAPCIPNHVKLRDSVLVINKSSEHTTIVVTGCIISRISYCSKSVRRAVRAISRTAIGRGVVLRHSYRARAFMRPSIISSSCDFTLPLWHTHRLE